MIDTINALAAAIDARWREQDYSVYRFTDIAFEELKKRDLTREFSFAKLNDLLDRPEIRQIQIASEFSELHFKLFDNGRFYIEVLNWWDKDTSIHDHGFAGVLLQLEGTALNALYSFDDEAEVLSQTLRFGEIRLSGAELSRKGDMRVIPYGRAEKHAVIHIERPTVSLIVRTHPVADISPQLNYFPPNVLANHSASDIPLNKRVKYFKLLAGMDAAQFRAQLLATLSRSSRTDGFWLLMKLGELVFKPGRVELLRDWLAAAPSVAERDARARIVAAVASRRASQFIVDRVKPLFRDHETRLLLAGLSAAYNMEERGRIMSLIGVEDHKAKTEAVRKSLPAPLAAEFSACLNILHPEVEKECV